jgi:phosphatidylglycerophosphate synthase
MLDTLFAELPAQLDQLPVSVRRKIDQAFERALELDAHPIQIRDSFQELHLGATDRIAGLLLALQILRTRARSLRFVFGDARLIFELRQEGRELRDLGDDPAHARQLGVRLLDRVCAEPLHGSKIICARQTSLMQERAWRIADAITWLRILLVPVIWVYALLGDGRVVGAGLIAAGVTDFLDGLVARRFGQSSSTGARLDLTADTLLLVSAVFWIGMMHPDVVSENVGLIAIAFLTYLVSVGVGVLNFRRLPNLHLYSSKLAGGLLYAFAVITLVAGRYDKLLLALAAGAFMLSCVETLAGELLFSVAEANMGSVVLERRRRAEINNVQARGSASKQRSQAPTANEVGSKASPISSSPTAATPSPNDRRA